MKGLLCYGKNKSKFLRSGERQRGRRTEAQKWLVWRTDKGIGVNMASGCLGAAKNACEKMGNVKWKEAAPSPFRPDRRGILFVATVCGLRWRQELPALDIFI